jgi:hypothetical protein
MNTPHPSAASYRPYKGLPPLAGYCTFEEAQRPGLSIDECVHRLKRYHWAFKRLHEIFLARLAAEPIYELKMAFSLHAHYCAEHTAALRARVGEMREPPLGLDLSPDPNLDIFFDEILAAPATEALLWAIYRKAVRHLSEDISDHLSDTNPLADAPSVRVLKFALIELEQMSDYGEKAVEALVTPEHTMKFGDWLDLLDNCLAAAGGLAGTQPKSDLPIEREHSARPFIYDGIPRRDERFPDPYNMGVNAEAFIYDESYPPAPKVPMIFYKRLREIDVPEMMASIITETKGKPWGYYRDMTRQLWDEARHAMMGEVGFVNLGVDWHKVMVNFTWSLGLNTQLSAKERHGVLYFIEQGLMPKTGKRFEWEVAKAADNELSALFQDYDWADEVLHARVGRDWYVSQFETPKEAVEWGDRAWSKVLIGWRQWRDEGLTQHRNWWPDVYLDFCRAQGLEPDDHVLAFAETYEAKRADLRAVSASA